MNHQYFYWNNEKISKYILGTAQLGLDYGIANKDGKPDLDKAELIIKSAWDAGARTFDTASGYGESEFVLGRSLELNGFTGDSKVITKILPSDESGDFSWIESSVEKSIKNLGIPYLWSVLLHRYDMLKEWDDGLGEVLNRLKAEKTVRYLGVSVYTSEEVRDALNYPDIDIIQAPCNLWSPELFKEGIIESALKKNKLIIVRSLFLQGLMLMSPDEVLLRLPEAYAVSLKWQDILQENNTSAWDMCMRFAASLQVPVIMGADNEKQALSNGKFLSMQTLTSDEIHNIYERLKPYLSEKIVNPTMWK